MLLPTPPEPPPPPRAVPEMIKRVTSNLPEWIREEVFGPESQSGAEYFETDRRGGSLPAPPR